MKKEKRSLFEKIFKKDVSRNLYSYKVLNGYESYFTGWGKVIYDSKVARTSINSIATHGAKMEPKHVKGDQHILGEIDFLLANRPNPIMNTYDFLYKVISQRETFSNAFIFIDKDSSNMIKGFYPILSSEVKLLQDKGGKVFVRFRFKNGQIYTLPYEDIIHLRKFYNEDDYWGSKNDVLYTDLETAHISSEGTKNAIKTTNSLKGILNYENSYMKSKDLKESRDTFIQDFLSDANTSGIASLDAKAKFQEINMKPIMLDNEQLKRVNQNIYDYFGISEDVVRNDYTPEKWNAFYEGVLEPLAIQMSQAFTNAIFSKESIKDGNKIIFTTSRLQYASIEQKVKLLNTVLPYGVLTKDKTCDILDIEKIGGEEGKKILQSLNNINSDIADQYQGG